MDIWVRDGMVKFIDHKNLVENVDVLINVRKDFNNYFFFRNTLSVLIERFKFIIK